jgi:RNA recognition motif-containing protein
MKTTEKTNNNTVYISNLSYERDRNGLKSMFSPFGEIKSIKIIVEPATNQSRGMAFVEMANPSEAKKAIDGLNQKIFDGRTVKANFATALKPTSISKRATAEKEPKKDLTFLTTQLAKKARNDAKRSPDRFNFNK